MQTRSEFAIASALLTSIVIAASANAATVQATLDSMPYKAVAGISVVSSERTVSQQVYAGLFRWHGVAGNPLPLQNAFESFCIDIKDHVQIGHTYTYESQPLEFAPITNGLGSGINSDLAGGMGDKASLICELWAGKRSLVTSDATAAAMQLAIWNIVYDEDWTVSSGDFRITSISIPQAQTLANQWLADVRDGSLGSAHLMAISSTTLQDQVVVGAPLPAGVWCGMVMLAGLVVHRVRRARMA